MSLFVTMLTYAFASWKQFGWAYPKADRLKPILLRRRHIDRWRLRVLLQLLPVGAIRIQGVWRGGRIGVRVYRCLPWHCRLACGIPDEFPLLIGIATQIYPQRRPFDLASHPDDIPANR